MKLKRCIHSLKITRFPVRVVRTRKFRLIRVTRTCEVERGRGYVTVNIFECLLLGLLNDLARICELGSKSACKPSSHPAYGNSFWTFDM